MLLAEGLPTVFARHWRIADGIRVAVGPWGLTLAARSPDLHSDTVSAILTPDGVDATRLVQHAARE